MLREGAEKFGSARRRVPGCRRDSGRGIDARFHGGAGRTNLEDVTPHRHLAVAVAGHIAAVDDAVDALARKHASVAPRELCEVGRRVPQLIRERSRLAVGLVNIRTAHRYAGWCENQRLRQRARETTRTTGKYS